MLKIWRSVAHPPRFDSKDGIPEDEISDRVSRAIAIATGKLRFPCAVPDVLCKRCKQLNSEIKRTRRRSGRKWRDGQLRLMHHPTVEQAIRSASEGCHLCTLLVGVLSRASPASSSTASAQTYSIAAQLPWALSLHLYPKPVDGENTEGVDKFVDISIGRARQMVLTTPSTESNETFACISRWLRECLNGHVRCTEAREEAIVIPPRLLQISSSRGSLNVRLISGEDLPEARYICLSHCWGKITILKLVQANEALLRQDVSLEDLPQTFLDAVAIAWRLGLEYLWIDSLCIVQDSKDDWLKHTQLMGSIYRNAVLVIAASKAKDASEGCFSRRNPLSYVPCSAPGFAEGDVKYAYNELLSAREFGPDDEGYGRPALHSRAWAVQERALGPRTVYFGTGMVFWECIECTASEIHPEFRYLWPESSANSSSEDLAMRRRHPLIYLWDVQDLPHPPPLGLKLDLAKLLSLGASSPKDYASWRHHWWYLIQAYSECSLTFMTDKPIAFAGMADLVQRAVGRTLVHGLWQEHLSAELFWSASPASARTPERAPSWSWLSIDGAIQKSWQFDDDRGKELLTTAVVLGVDPSGWEIDLVAPLIKIHSEFTIGGWYQAIVPETNMLGYELWWKHDVASQDLPHTWALQLRVQRPIKGSNFVTFFGIIVVPFDETRKKWVRVGSYRFGEESLGVRITPEDVDWESMTERVTLV